MVDVYLPRKDLPSHFQTSRAHPCPMPRPGKGRSVSTFFQRRLGHSTLTGCTQLSTSNGALTDHCHSVLHNIDGPVAAATYSTS